VADACARAQSFHTRRTGPEFQKHIPRFVNSVRRQALRGAARRGAD
jgi:hypothetical protein